MVIPGKKGVFLIGTFLTDWGEVYRNVLVINFEITKK
jgi:hypothetical protein